MKQSIKFGIWIFIISFIAAACNLNQEKPQLVDLGEKENYIVIADSLISDVLVLNPDEDEWTDHCLRNLNRKLLVEQIFKAVYDEKLEPFEFFNNTAMSIDDIKALESDPEFSRDNIAKVQFEEAWYFEPVSQSMIKKVHSIMLAYQVYNSDGEIRGYKPAFKVYFK